jgi:hypothetical protein
LTTAEGGKPADLPVEQAQLSYMKAPKRSALSSETLLATADEVIQ